MLKASIDTSQRRARQALDWLLPVTIFLSAYLLFQVQPLISKFILPWFGGSPAVWTTAMLFFQSVLFGGYAYAHLTSRHLSLKQQTLLHVCLLSLSAVVAYFILPPDFLKPTGDEEPVARILLLLTLSVGIPYFTLATTGPLIQAWFAQVYPDRSPYRLYSLSNVGSFAALLSFPYLFEPVFELPVLGRFWTAGFWLFALACAIAALRMLHLTRLGVTAQRESKAESNEYEPISLWRCLGWIALPALASLTLVAVTDHVSHNVAPEPRLWIATLSLYLLTFIITFDHARWYRRKLVAAICLLSILLLSGQGDLKSLLNQEWSLGVSELRWSHLTVMFLICFVCHGELVRLKPKSHRYLTEFYLYMSLGGACGGLFVTFVAVNFFDDYYEWPLCLLLGAFISTYALVTAWFTREAGAQLGNRYLVPALVALVATTCVGWLEDPFDWRAKLSTEYRRTRLYANRNFYGSVTVIDRQHHTDPRESYRTFFSGAIKHGSQFTAADRLREPTTYYSEDSGVGQALRYAQSKQPSMRVALVGLGTGTLATYARPQDEYDFYEINPEVVRIADEFFTFVPRCAAKNRVVLGDARLKLAAADEELKYDMIVLDAFSGDSVPVHLLTREAFEIYAQHLKPGGAIVVHITNAYLNLYPIVDRQAEHLGLPLHYRYSAPDYENLVYGTRYVTLTHDPDFPAASGEVPAETHDDHGHPVAEAHLKIDDAPLWTDHYSSLGPIQW